jgi:hypothetical protein
VVEVPVSATALSGPNSLTTWQRLVPPVGLPGTTSGLPFSWLGHHSRPVDVDEQFYVDQTLGLVFALLRQQQIVDRIPATIRTAKENLADIREPFAELAIFVSGRPNSTNGGSPSSAGSPPPTTRRTQSVAMYHRVALRVTRRCNRSPHADSSTATKQVAQ